LPGAAVLILCQTASCRTLRVSTARIAGFP
jgi:hypothetical protein